jgi:hypothetical protein
MSAVHIFEAPAPLHSREASGADQEEIAIMRCGLPACAGHATAHEFHFGLNRAHARHGRGVIPRE